jgi:7-carboxy-7-deazaguanine synthase
MNTRQIIPADHYKTRKEFHKEGEKFLNVSEFFYDTIQGEGINIGVPSAFLRLQGCSMNCSYCDTNEVWRYGTPWSFKELIQEIDKTDLPEKLQAGQHLVISGGSPLLQQERLANFLVEYDSYYGYSPFTEIENECVIQPNSWLSLVVNCWNNSPKLASSGMPTKLRYQPEVLAFLSKFSNSWFKFVISHGDEWNEIEELYLKPKLIKRNQIILMPEGATREELEKNRDVVMEMAIRHGVRYSTREHIIIWSKKIGV